MEKEDVLEDGEILDEYEKIPIFDIKFHSHEAHKKYGEKILSALHSTFKSDEKNKSETLEFNIPENNKNTPIIINVYIGKPNQESEIQVDDDVDISSLFVVDAKPNKTIETVTIPSYKRSIKDALNDETAEKKKKNDEDICERPTNSKVCFNCLSSKHSLRDCPKQRNMKRINRSKKAFVGKSERYHNDVEQRFGHLVPGKISENLRVALNLRKGEIPSMFYQMRKLGYPPGWLQHAIVENSGISLISNENDIVDKKCTNGVSYDVTKIIEFDGFNHNPGPNFFDDYKYHNVPPMSNYQMKSEFIKMLGGNIIKGYKRKKLKLLPNLQHKLETPVPVFENTDMELEENDDVQNVIFTRPPPPTEDHITKPPTPPLPPVIDENINSSTSPISIEKDIKKNCSKSPTLQDLEAQQEALLEQLTTNKSLNESSVDDIICLDSTIEDFNVSDNQNLNDVSTPLKRMSSPIKTGATTIDKSFEGTPLLKFTPFDQLPSGDNFKVGVSDVINFENLPDSTGKYEQMKIVIKNVRNKMKYAMENDDEDEDEN